MLFFAILDFVAKLGQSLQRLCRVLESEGGFVLGFSGWLFALFVESKIALFNGMYLHVANGISSLHKVD